MSSYVPPAPLSENTLAITTSDSGHAQAPAIKPGSILHPRHDVLSSEAFSEAWLAYKNGSIVARDKLLLANQRLVMRCVRNLANVHPSEVDDLFQQGHLGLHRALERFNPELGAFSTYATRWVQSSIQEMRSKNASDVYLPQATRKLKNKVALRVLKLERAGCENAKEEAAQGLGVSMTTISSMLALKTHSLQATVGHKEDAEQSQTLQDTLADEGTNSPEDFTQGSQVSRLVDALLSTLTNKEAQVIRLYFGISAKDCDQSFSEMARHIGGTREGLRQTFLRASRKLQAQGGDAGVMEALDGIQQ